MQITALGRIELCQILFGLLQIWRMMDLIYRPEDEVMAELDKFKSHILGCDTVSDSATDPATPSHL